MAVKVIDLVARMRADGVELTRSQVLKLDGVLRSAARNAAATPAGMARALQPLEARVALLAKGVQQEGTRAQSLAKLAGVEQGLSNALERGNLTLSQRVQLTELLARAQRVRADATARETAATEQAARAEEARDAARARSDLRGAIGRARGGSLEGIDALAARTRTNVEGLAFASTRAASVAGLERAEAALSRALAAGNLTTAQRVRLERERKAATDALHLPRLERQEAALRAQLASGNVSLLQRVRLRQQLRGVEAQIAGRGAAGVAGATAGGLGGFGGLGALLAGGVAVSALNGMADASDRAEIAQRKLGATSKLTGVALGTIQGIATTTGNALSLSEQTAGDLTGAMVKLSARAGEVPRTGAALTAWLDLAAANGLTATEALQALETTLIGQDEGLNRLGLSNPQQIYERWARSAGTTAAKMTDAQKALAILNEVTERGKLVEGEYAKSLETSRGAQERRQRATEQAAAAMGKALAPLRDAYNDTLAGMAGFVGRNPDFVVAAGAAAGAFTVLAGAVTLLNRAMAVGAATDAPRFLAGLRALGAFLMSPAGLAIAAAAGAVGVVTWAGAQERARAAAPAQAAGRVAAEVADGDVVPNLLATREQEARLLQQIRDGAPTVGMSGKEVQAANARNAQLTKELTFVRELVQAYEARAAAMTAPAPAPARGAVAGAGGGAKVGTAPAPSGPDLSALEAFAPTVAMTPDGAQERAADAIARAIGKVPLKLDVKVSDLAQRLNEAREQLEQSGKGLGMAFNAAFGDAIEAGFYELGRGGDPFAAFGKTLLAGFGSVLVSLGKQALAASGFLAAIRVSFKSLNPFAMAAAGVGLIALGSFIGGMGSRALSGASAAAPSLAAGGAGGGDATIRYTIGDPYGQTATRRAAMPGTGAVSAAPTAAPSLPSGATAAPRTPVNVNLIAFGTLSPTQERELMTTIRRAEGREL